MKHLELYLGLGSNDVRKEYWMDRAIELITSSLAMPYTALSDKIVTKSWGFDGPDFLNCVVRYDIPDAGQDPELHARALLHIFQDIERQLGRTRYRHPSLRRPPPGLPGPHHPSPADAPARLRDGPAAASADRFKVTITSGGR